MSAISRFAGTFLSCVLLALIVTLGGCQSAKKSPTEAYMKSPPCEIKTGEAALKAEQNQAQNSRMIRGDVMEVEGSNYVVKDQDGKEVTLKSDKTTVQPIIQQGQYIEASVNEQNHVLWIRTDNSTDRRNEHAAADCAPN